MFIADDPPNAIQAPLGAARIWIDAWPAAAPVAFISMPLLTEVRQGKLGCSEGESPSRLMEESVFRTKEKNGKV
jgi:hypothetical protein